VDGGATHLQLGASVATRQSQRHPDSTPSCQSSMAGESYANQRGIASGSRSAGLPGWNINAIRNGRFGAGGISKRVGPATPNKT
jgi:hypothetical protein